LADEELVWQGWRTMAGVTISGFSLTTSSEDYLDLGDTTSLEVHTHLLNIEGATLALQTASSEEGPWESLQSYTAATDASIIVNSAVSSNHELERYLRWEITAPTEWQATFRITVAAPAGQVMGGHVELPVDPYERGAVELAEWTSYRVAYTTSSTTNVIADREDWLDTDEMRYLNLETEATLLSAATLVLESAFSEEGPWTTIASYTQAYTVDRVVMSWQPSGSVPALARYIRWHLEGQTGGGAGSWEACFRVNGKWS